MSKPRPPIPPTMKRNIRKRCGYGCVICGKPIYEYHHINGYKEEGGHIEAEITLLCDGCHRKEQGGLIPRDMVIAHDKAPKNWKTGQSTPDQVWYSNDSVLVDIGGNAVIVPPHTGMEFFPLMMDGKGIIKLRFEDGVWLLTLLMCDPFNQAYLTVVENELSYVIGDCDINYVNGRVEITIGKQSVFAASFKNSILAIQNGSFHWNGIAAAVLPEGFMCLNNGNMWSGMMANCCKVGFSLGRNPKGYGGMSAFGVPNRQFPTQDYKGTIEVAESEVELDPNEID